MGMEINRNRGPVNQGTGSTKSKPAAGSKSSSSATAGKQDDKVQGESGATFSLTDRASELQALEQKIADLPIVDSGKVEAVKDAIRDGSHEIDPPRITEKMLSMEISMAIKDKQTS